MKETKMAVADKIVAEEIEVRKTVRKAARTVKEVKEEAAAQVKEVVADKLALKKSKLRRQ